MNSVLELRDKIGKVYHNETIIDEYIKETLKRVDVEAIRSRKLKVVVDCGSGAGSYTAPYLLKALGCEVTTLNCQADGFFPGRDPEPIEPNLQDLIATVKDLGADIGLAHDGDADRTICIDEKGNFVLGDKTFALVEKQMLKENNGGIIVTTVATSRYCCWRSSCCKKTQGYRWLIRRRRKRRFDFP